MLYKYLIISFFNFKANTTKSINVNKCVLYNNLKVFKCLFFFTIILIFVIIKL